MHSSRMRTARSLTACRNVVGGACMAGGHAWQGGVHGRWGVHGPHREQNDRQTGVKTLPVTPIQ